MLAAGTVIAVTTYRGRMSGPGGGTLVLFALLAALTALSVTWSVAPGLSYIEAGRTLTYLAVFAAGVAAARLAPRSPGGHPHRRIDRRRGDRLLRARFTRLAGHSCGE